MRYRFVGGLSLAFFFVLHSLAFGQQAQDAASQPSPASQQVAQSDSPSKPVPSPAPPDKHKVGPLDISINWRTRAEGWNWFEGTTGNSDYGFWDSLLRVGIGQSWQRFDCSSRENSLRSSACQMTRSSQLRKGSLAWEEPTTLRITITPTKPTVS